MAQIITLKDHQGRLALLRELDFDNASDNQMPRGPAKLLFFTGVRYERYGDIGPQNDKLSKRPRRKKSMQH